MTRKAVGAPARSPLSPGPQGAGAAPGAAATAFGCSGNAAFARLVTGAGATPWIARAPATAATPAAPAPPGTPAAAPAAGDAPLTFKGRLIFPDAARNVETLRRVVAESGLNGMREWVSTARKPDFAVYASWTKAMPEDRVKASIDALEAAKDTLEKECETSLQRFETAGNNITDKVLDNAKQQVESEQKRLGITADGTPSGEVAYSASNTDAIAAAKKEAGPLAAMREETDHRKQAADDALKRSQLMTKPPALTTRGTVGGPDPKLVAERERTHTLWQDAEQQFRQQADAAIAKHPLLGPMLAGGENTTARLRAFAAESNAQSAQTIGAQLQDKLGNIRTVRGELGERFSIYKHAPLLELIHKQLDSTPTQRRLVLDKAQQVQEQAANTKAAWAAIALGLGLLAAIPTGGVSLLTVATGAAAIGAAGASAYQAYESAQDYALESAAADTSLDRAYQISKDEPSLMYLAVDIATAIVDLGAAAAALKAVKAVLETAKAGDAVAKIPQVRSVMAAAGVSEANVGRAIAELLPVGGDVNKALVELRKAVVSAAEAPGVKNARFMERVRDAATMALEKNVILVPRDAKAAEKILAETIMSKAERSEMMTELFARNAKGVYGPVSKRIVLVGDSSVDTVAGVLVHELTHRGQDAMRAAEQLDKFTKEFEAFKAQREFLRNLPAERYAEIVGENRRLLTASDNELAARITKVYDVPQPRGSNADKASNVFYDRLLGQGGPPTD